MSTASKRLNVLNLAFGKSLKSTKHSASKKNFKHVKNLSKGELNHQKFIQGGK